MKMGESDLPMAKSRERHREGDKENRREKEIL
jgi:hypothetical protein